MAAEAGLDLADPAGHRAAGPHHQARHRSRARGGSRRVARRGTRPREPRIAGSVPRRPDAATCRRSSCRRCAGRSPSAWSRARRRCPHFYLTVDVAMDRLWDALPGAARSRSTAGLAQRHHHQGRRLCAAAPPRDQRVVRRRPRQAVLARAHRHGGRARGRPDHARHPRRRLRSRSRRSRTRRGRWPSAPASRESAAARVHGRHLLDLEPRHDGHRGVLGHHQPARGGDPGRRRRAQRCRSSRTARCGSAGG